MSQKHNSYIIKTRLNEWLLDSVLYICYFIILLIPPFLYVWTPSKTAKYLRNILKNLLANIEIMYNKHVRELIRFDYIIEYWFLNVLYRKLSNCCFLVPRRNGSF